MRAGVIFFDLQGFQRSRLGLWEGVAWRSHPEEPHQSVNVAEAGVRFGVRRVGFDSLTQEFKTLLDAVGSPPIRVVHRFEEELMGLGVTAGHFRERLFLRKAEPNAQFIRDLLSNF